MFPKVLFGCEKCRPTTWIDKFLTFSHPNSVFFQPNWLYIGLKTQLVWKKTQFIGENVKNLLNHVVGRRFHNETKPQKTFHCVLIVKLHDADACCSSLQPKGVQASSTWTSPGVIWSPITECARCLKAARSFRSSLAKAVCMSTTRLWPICPGIARICAKSTFKVTHIVSETESCMSNLCHRTKKMGVRAIKNNKGWLRSWGVSDKKMGWLKVKLFHAQILFKAQCKTLYLPLLIGWRVWLFKAYLCTFKRLSQAANAD